MGSSSSLTVGLLNALYAYKGQVTSARRLAEESCRIEIDILKKPIGRQDQYAAAFGGMNYMRFNPDHTVDVEPVPCRPETQRELEKSILLLYTDKRRDADTISEGPERRYGFPVHGAAADARPGRRDARRAHRRRRPR